MNKIYIYILIIGILVSAFITGSMLSGAAPAVIKHNSRIQAAISNIN